MNDYQQKKLSVSKKYSGFLLLISATVGTLYGFTMALLNLTDKLASIDTIVTYDNTVFFTLAGGLALASLSLYMFYIRILNRPFTHILNKIYLYFGLILIVIMFIWPYFSSQYLENYMATKAYKICEVPSSIKKFYQKVTYTNNSIICTALIRNKCMEPGSKCNSRTKEKNKCIKPIMSEDRIKILLSKFIELSKTIKQECWHNEKQDAACRDDIFRNAGLSYDTDYISARNAYHYYVVEEYNRTHPDKTLDCIKQ